jgi:hypothetical protein
MKINGDNVIDSLEFDDARTGYRCGSLLNTQEINRACTEALRRRGIGEMKFNRMDFVRPRSRKKS